MYKTKQYEVVRESGNKFRGARPLQSIDSNVTKLVFGGELIGQSLMAAYETVPEDWSPHSFHSYFLRPASTDSIMNFEVIENSNGKNYKNRVVNCYQSETKKLCFMCVVSFCERNDNDKRKLEYEKNPNPPDKVIPYEFQFKPNEYFYKYKDNLDETVQLAHTNESIQVFVPNEIFEPAQDAEKALDIGERRLGYFVRVNVDEDNKPPFNKKANYSDLAFISDSTTLVIFFRILGIAFSFKYFWYKYATLDQNIYFHDDDFDIRDWLFIDYKFLRLNNGRVLFLTHGFNKHGKLVMTVTQEANVQIPKKVIDNATGGSYKL